MQFFRLGFNTIYLIERKRKRTVVNKLSYFKLFYKGKVLFSVSDFRSALFPRHWIKKKEK